ncbi:MAG: hypothetical protein K1X74_06810 [Pirellulales bacterium]|nr:hypothetical protein [Pirellulales bacterium]
MPQTTFELATRRLFTELKPGDRVRVVHEVKVGLKTWKTETRGTVVSTDRRRHGLHNRRNVDDKVWSDLILLKRDDGELTTVTIDEWTELYRA